MSRTAERVTAVWFIVAFLTLCCGCLAFVFQRYDAAEALLMKWLLIWFAVGLLGLAAYLAVKLLRGDELP